MVIISSSILLYIGHVSGQGNIELHKVSLFMWSQFLAAEPWAIRFGISGPLINTDSICLNFMYAILFWIVLTIWLYPKTKIAKFLFSAMLIFSISSVLRISQYLCPGFLTTYHNFVGGRYEYIPTLMCAWLLVLSIADAKRSYCKFGIAAILLLLLLWHSFVNFHTNMRPVNYHWSFYATLARTDQ